MKRNSLACLLVSALLFSAQTVADAVSPEIAAKAQIIAEVLNGVAPKKNGSMTILKASNDANTVTVSVDIDSPGVEQLTDEQYDQLVPILQKAFFSKTCLDLVQRPFINEGGALVYEMTETNSGREFTVSVINCDEVDAIDGIDIDNAEEKSDDDSNEDLGRDDTERKVS